jgi:hypothetical protein
MRTEKFGLAGKNFDIVRATGINKDVHMAPVSARIERGRGNVEGCQNPAWALTGSHLTFLRIQDSEGGQAQRRSTFSSQAGHCTYACLQPKY